MINRQTGLPMIFCKIRCVYLQKEYTCFPGVVFLGLLLAIMFLSTGCTSTGNTISEPDSANRYEKSSARYHKVRKGDTLYAISFKAGVDFRTLAAWNRLPKPYVIYPGQVLRLTPPSRSSSKPQKSSAPKTAATGTPKTTKQDKNISSQKTASVSSSAPLKWKWPTKGKVVSYYSSKDSARDGIKISGKKNQQIFAAEAGKVVYVGSGLVGYGRLIIIKHNNKYLSAYGLNSKLLVKEGDSVKREQKIALMGEDNTGRPVLHFEIRKYGKPVNPISYLPK